MFIYYYCKLFTYFFIIFVGVYHKYIGTTFLKVLNTFVFVSIFGKINNTNYLFHVPQLLH